MNAETGRRPRITCKKWCVAAAEWLRTIRC